MSVVGSGDGVRKLPVQGRPTTLVYGRAGPAVLAAGAGWVGYVLYFCLNLVYPMFLS